MSQEDSKPKPFRFVASFLFGDMGDGTFIDPDGVDWSALGVPVVKDGEVIGEAVPQPDGHEYAVGGRVLARDKRGRIMKFEATRVAIVPNGKGMGFSVGHKVDKK